MIRAELRCSATASDIPIESRAKSAYPETIVVANSVVVQKHLANSFSTRPVNSKSYFFVCGAILWPVSPRLCIWDRATAPKCSHCCSLDLGAILEVDAVYLAFATHKPEVDSDEVRQDFSTSAAEE